MFLTPALIALPFFVQCSFCLVIPLCLKADVEKQLRSPLLALDLTPSSLEIFVMEFLLLIMSLRTSFYSLPDLYLLVYATPRIRYQLAAINPSINPTCSNLMPGSTLCLGYSGEDCTATHVVASDDTCDFITSMHKLNSTILYMNNPQINQACTNIYIGEVRIRPIKGCVI